MNYWQHVRQSVRKCAFGIERLQCYINPNGHHFKYFWRKNHCFISLFNDKWLFIV